MTELLSSVIRWIGDKLALFIVIVALLVVVGLIRNELAVYGEKYTEIGTLQSVIEGLEARIQDVERERQRAKDALGPVFEELRELEHNATNARNDSDECARRRDDWSRFQQLWNWQDFKKKQAKCEGLKLVAESWEQALENLKGEPAFGVIRALEQRRDELHRQVGLLEEKVRELMDFLESSVFSRFVTRVISVLPVAVAILLGVLAMPLLTRAFFYYVLAPKASRLPPIQILPQSNAPDISDPGKSQVSMLVLLRPDEEMLVRPDFLTAMNNAVVAKTMWFLNNRLPFASIASGMFALTRLRAITDSETTVVVSSINDPLAEISIIDLPEGAAMVIQPRSLAGIVKPIGRAVTITRHWRLTSLHAWLTLQLRYLVFHGPCRLIVKGCRGVRVDSPDDARPRMIRQAATMGFSANLDYKTVRSEVFLPYLTQRAELFNDRFSGGPGRFVYEEMPSAGRRRGALGRGLEGFVDASLKVFGI